MMSPLKFITCPLEINVELLFPVTLPAGEQEEARESQGSGREVRPTPPRTGSAASPGLT